MKDDLSPEQLMLLTQMVNNLSNAAFSFTMMLHHLGCHCPWGDTEELNESDIVFEVERPWFLRDHQLLILINEDLQQKLDYHYAAVGRRVLHEPKCKAMMALRAPLN